jgi:hypothetical protein
VPVATVVFTGTPDSSVNDAETLAPARPPSLVAAASGSIKEAGSKMARQIEQDAAASLRDAPAGGE